MKIDYEKLIIEKVVLETRFSKGFLYWDNCGKIWADIYEKWPELEMISVTPEKAVLKLKGQSMDLVFSHKHIVITQDYPVNLKMFIEVASYSIPTISKHLQVNSFSRVGHRVFYSYPTSDIKEAEEIFSTFSLLNVSDEKVKLFGDNLSRPSVSFKIENDDHGYTFNIAAQSRNLELDFPNIVRVDSSAFKKDIIHIDVDYYTKKDFDLPLLNVSDFINSLDRRIKTKFSSFLHSD